LQGGEKSLGSEAKRQKKDVAQLEENKGDAVDNSNITKLSLWEQV
jgi:hypothetical protein